jgi:uncharacterized protein YbcI
LVPTPWAKQYRCELYGSNGDRPITTIVGSDNRPPVEKTIMDSGQPDRVIAMREDFQRVMADRYRETIETLTGRKVVAFRHQAHVEPHITMEIFFI